MTHEPVLVGLPIADLVLASASSSRAKILTDAGLGFCQYPVMIDEEAVRMAGVADMVPASDIAIMLAEMKAGAAVQLLSIENKMPPAYVLGCDQILVCEDKIYNKPLDVIAAKSQLLALSGKTHQLFTAVVLFRHCDRIWHCLSVASMTMRNLDSDFIDAYIEQLGDAAFISPASYQIEGIGAQLFSHIKGCHYSILGLPLLEVLAILREHGLDLRKDKS